MAEDSIDEKFELDLSDILLEIREMLMKKRADYSNSYEIIRKKYGEITPLIRLNDKFTRLEQLIVKNKEPQNEPIIDTYKDIIGYAILELMYRKTTKKP